MIRCAAKFILAAAACLTLTGAQFGGLGGNGQPTYATITLDSHSSSPGASGTTTTLTLSPTAGDGITCEYAVQNSHTFVSVTDNKNSGAYSAGLANYLFSGVYMGIYYKSSVAAGSTVVTLTASGSGALSLECQAWKRSIPLAFHADSTMAQQQPTTGKNPTSGTAKTPANSQSIVIGYLTASSITPTAGTNYTIVDPDTTYTFYPEYWIQTAATSTNTPYVYGTSVAYDDAMAAFYFQ